MDHILRDVVAYSEQYQVNRRIAACMPAFDGVAFAVKLLGIYN